MILVWEAPCLYIQLMRLRPLHYTRASRIVAAAKCPVFRIMLKTGYLSTVVSAGSDCKSAAKTGSEWFTFCAPNPDTHFIQKTCLCRFAAIYLFLQGLLSQQH